MSFSVFRIITIGLLLLANGWLDLPSNGKTNLPIRSAKLGKKIYRLEVATTPSERARGLSKRAYLVKNGGMVFVFPEAKRHYFCMEEMNFPLDFVWIKGDEIIDLSENVPFNPKPKNFSARQDFDKAIELNAGEIQASGLKVGDKVTLLLN